ncbi:MAG: hypothetical protein ACJAW3_001606 [Lentimonas sp.]|jgi:hypothetical protein
MKNILKCADVKKSNLTTQLQQAIEDYDQRNKDFQPPEHPSKIFSKGYLLNLAGTLGLDQIITILQMESIREQGLSLARSGKILEAKIILKKADNLSKEADLSRHGYNAIRTFQAAADAYIAYREQKYELGVELLEESIEACRILSDEFGHDMEFRKSHLGRNIIRTQCFIKPAEEIIQSTFKIIAYILGDHDSWPFENQTTWSNKRLLTNQESMWNIDENITNLLMPEVNLNQVNITKFLPTESGTMKAVYELIMTMSASINNQKSETYTHALAFFTHAPYGLPHAKNKIEGLLL